MKHGVYEITIEGTTLYEVYIHGTYIDMKLTYSEANQILRNWRKSV